MADRNFRAPTGVGYQTVAADERAAMDQLQVLGTGERATIDRLRAERVTPERGTPPAGRNLLAPTGTNLLEDQELSWLEVGKRAITNVPASGQQFFSDMWNAVRHPIDTGGTLYDVADGVVRLMVPGGDSPNEDKARAVGGFFADRYGSVKGFKHAVATDPVGVLGDFAAVLTGGGAAGARLPGVLGQVARTAGTAGRAIDPVMLAGKGVGKVWSGVKNVPGANIPIPGVKDLLAAPLGAWTGTGGAPIVRAGEAGFAGGKRSEAFVEGMREPAALDRIVAQARGALGKIKQAASDSYKATMGKVAEYTKPIPFDPINKAFREVADSGTYKGVDVTPSVRKLVDEMADVIDEWRARAPEDFHTPMGLDALKQRIWDMGEGLEHGSAGRRVVGNVYHAIKDEIIANAPEYGKAMKDYERAKTLIGDIEHALKIGSKAKADTSIRALTSIMRNNVNTNLGKRLSLAETLEKAGAPTMIDSIAGASMSSPMPRGIQGATAPIGGLALTAGVYSDVLPGATLAAIPASSPRLVGEAVHLGARGAGLARDLLQSPVGRATVGSPPARLATNEMGRLERELRTRPPLRMEIRPRRR